MPKLPKICSEAWGLSNSEVGMRNDSISQFSNLVTCARLVEHIKEKNQDVKSHLGAELIEKIPHLCKILDSVRTE